MLRTAMLAGGLAAMLAGCGGPAERGPAWPKARPSETDGGESLAPRQPSAIAAIEAAEDGTPSAPAAAPPSTATPAASPGARPDEAPPPREPDILTTEDLIIEIDD